MGLEPNHSTARKKAWSSINHSILVDAEYVHTVHKLSILHRNKALVKKKLDNILKEKGTLVQFKKVKDVLATRNMHCLTKKNRSNAYSFSVHSSIYFKN